MRLVHLVVIEREFDLLRLLIDHGAHLNVVTVSHRKNLLHLVCDQAVEQTNDTLLEVTRTLIDRGCEINQRDDCFETPLMCTLHHGGDLALGKSSIPLSSSTFDSTSMLSA